MSWQRVAALALLVGGAVAAAKFHNDLIAATLAGAAAGFAINRNGRPGENVGAAAGLPSVQSDDQAKRKGEPL